MENKYGNVWNIRNTDELDLDEMISKSFWRDILYEIVNTMDPWDIDIAELATMYAGKVEQMREMNFRIPANVVIVSSVLLRMKSNFIDFGEGGFGEDEYDPYYDPDTGEWTDDPVQIMAGTGIIQDSGMGRVGYKDSERLLNLTVKPKRVPKRRITALELISAIQEVMEDKILKKKIKETNTERCLIIPMKKDIKQMIKKTYRGIMEILSRKDVVLLSEIAHGRDEMLHTLISLLHLSNMQKLKLRQKKMFDEIYIHSRLKGVVNDAIDMTQ